MTEARPDYSALNHQPPSDGDSSASRFGLDTPAAVEGPGDPHPRRWRIFGCVGIAMFMISINASIVATALPTLERDLGASLGWGSWTITVYMVGQIVAMPIVGRMSDLFGQRNVLLGGIALFAAASLACALSTSIQMLVCFRALQALGGGGILPAGTGIVSKTFGPGRDRAIGMFSSIFPIGGVTGPLIGGVLVNFLSWRWIFLVNVAIGSLLVVLAVSVIPRLPPPRSGYRQRLDLAGVGMLSVTVLTLMTAITMLGSGLGNGTSLGVASGFLAIGMISGWCALRHSRRAPHPFIAARLLTGRTFAELNLVNFLFGSVAFGFGTLTPLYAQLHYRMSSISSSTILVARSIGVVCVSAIVVFMLRRLGCRFPMIIGVIICAVALGLFASPPPSGVGPYWWLATTSGIMGIGVGIVLPASNNAGLELASDDISALVGVRGMFRQMGGIAAISVPTAVAAQAPDPGSALAWTFVFMALLQIIAIPLILRLPDRRGAW